MSTPSDTPETDAEQANARIQHQAIADKDWPWTAINEGWNFARKLERERSEARKETERQRAALKRTLDRETELRARVGDLEKALILAEDELGQTNEHLINRIAEGELVTIWQSDVEKTLELIRNTRLGRQAIDEARKGEK